MGRPARTDESTNVQQAPNRDGIRSFTSIAGHTLIVYSDMAIWDDTASKFVSEAQNSDLQWV